MTPQPLSDEGREAVIDILNQLCMNGTGEVRRRFWQLFKAEAALRTPAQVERMEIERGLRKQRPQSMAEILKDVTNKMLEELHR